MSVADELKKLAELRDSGVLTEAEFEKQKAKVLGEQAPGPSPSPTDSKPKEKSQTPFLVAVLLVIALGGGFVAFKTWNTENWQKTTALTSDVSLETEILKADLEKKAPLFCLYKGAIAYRLAEAREAGVSELVATKFTTDSELLKHSAAPSVGTARDMASAIYAEALPPALTRERYIERC